MNTSLFSFSNRGLCAGMVLLSFSLCFPSLSARADLIAHEPFDYESTELLGGCNGGSGWAGPWQGTALVGRAHYVFSDSSHAAAQSIAGISRGDASFIRRYICATGFPAVVASDGNIGKPGCQVWLKYYVTKHSGPPSSRCFGGLSIFKSGKEILFTGKRYNDPFWGFEMLHSTGKASPVKVNSGQAAVILLRIAFSNENTHCSFWVNPASAHAPQDEDALHLTLPAFTFNQLQFASGWTGIQLAFDDIKIGEHWQDVFAVKQRRAAHVSLNGTHQPPFGNWATAATNLIECLTAPDVYSRVIISNGIYRISESLMLDAQSVVSLNGPEATVFSLSRSNASLRIKNAVLEGITISNGYSELGGGLYCFANATVSNCIITKCNAQHGGGIFASGNATILQSLIHDCGANMGGGAYLSQASRIADSVIRNNTADCGGGIFNFTGGIIERSCVSNNTAETGGGIYSRNCFIEGAVYDSLVCANRAAIGGGLFSTNGGVWVENCTIADNNALHGAGVFCVQSSGFLNCIIMQNTTNNYCMFDPVYFNNCCVSLLNPSPDIITNSPIFKTIDGNEYRLDPTSPCVDTGVFRERQKNGKACDGSPRIQNGRVDIGAYEQ